jgi:hypothetical protein
MVFLPIERLVEGAFIGRNPKLMSNLSERLYPLLLINLTWRCRVGVSSFSDQNFRSSQSEEFLEYAHIIIYTKLRENTMRSEGQNRLDSKYLRFVS